MQYSYPPIKKKPKEGFGVMLAIYKYDSGLIAKFRFSKSVLDEINVTKNDMININYQDGIFTIEKALEKGKKVYNYLPHEFKASLLLKNCDLKKHLLAETNYEIKDNRLIINGYKS